VKEKGAHDSLNKDTLLDEYDLFFDAGDPLNGSLYLCQLRGLISVDLPPLCAKLRSAGLWSGQNPKRVEDSQRETYKRELAFLEAIAFSVGGNTVVIARFDHPEYPSSETRWRTWLSFFDDSYARVK
jgi:hypothetical protein